MADNLIGSVPSHFESYQPLLELADKYLKPGDYSTLKSGFLGYMTHSMAAVAGDAAYQRNILYRDNFLNTASTRRSILNFAKIYEYTVGLASPSSCRLMMGLFLDDIRRALGSETGSLTIPRGQPVLLGKYPFVLDGEVTITVLEGNRVSAEYNGARMSFPRPNGNTFIRTYPVQEPSGTGELRTRIYAEVHAHQAVLRSREFQVVTADLTQTTLFSVVPPVGEQLAGFRVFYTAPGAATKEIPAFFNDTSTPSLPEYCYYTYNEDGGVDVFFSSVPGAFRPAYNSRLQVEFDTTLGSDGNFNFTGTPSMSLSGPDGRKLAPVLTAVTTPAGGKNAESLMEVKQGILKKILLRNSIVIEKDLELYLDSTVERERVGGSFVSFIKRRDDIMKRTFGAFLLLKDNKGRVIPSNTARIDIDVMDLEARGWSLKPGTMVLYDRPARAFRLLDQGEYPESMINDVNSFVYCIPFLTEFRRYPFPRAVFYRNSADLAVSLDSGPGDVQTFDSFLMNSASVARNATFEDAYTIDMPVTTNLTNELLGGRVIMRAVIRDAVTGSDVGYTEPAHITGTNIFRFRLSTSDRFDEKSRMLIENSLRSVETGSLIPEAALPERVTMSIELYYNSGDTDVTVRHVVRTEGTSALIFQLARTFTSSEPFQLYRSLERVAQADMSVTSTGIFRCDGIPLVGAAFYLNSVTGAEVTGIIDTYHSAMLDAFDLLQNNTSVDVKLYNTYGPSLHYSVDRTNVSVRIQVRPTGRPSEELRARIIQSVSEFVASTNETDAKRFSISNLTTHLEQNFSDIAYIKFRSLNGVEMQSTEPIYTEEALEQDNRRVPEYLNVALLRVGSAGDELYIPDVTVEFI